MTEQRMTYDEWRHYENERQCRNEGHDYVHIETLGEGLVSVVCKRCGRTWNAQEQ